ncbi:hypothetical protein ISN44_As11g006320 [Arabidopsis suecica]|uniref:FBD domain-containing protein n=1 Tax=Arabidopsis suecica TaxID=45249 RepID=A0A8T1Z7S1_ARASU|nr:hypothetical protein ISN44_As11g006320 [Arabidopsis suecica]
MVLYPNRTSPTSGGGGFLDFVDRTLVLLGDSPIKKFSLKWNSQIDHSRYNHLIRNELETWTLGTTLVITIRTMVKLTLSHGFYAQDRLPPNGVLFPAFKTLSLSFKCVVLIFMTASWNLARTSIFYRSNDLEAHSLVALETPSLVYLDYSSYVSEDCDFQLDSLVEARLDLILWKYNGNIPPVGEYFGYDSTKGDDWGDATKLIAAIRNVVTLHLSADSLEVFHFCSRIQQPRSCAQDYEKMWGCMRLQTCEEEEILLFIVVSSEGTKG